MKAKTSEMLWLCWIFGSMAGLVIVYLMVAMKTGFMDLLVDNFSNPVISFGIFLVPAAVIIPPISIGPFLWSVRRRKAQGDAGKAKG